MTRRPGIGLFGFFALGFGCVVGSGWVVLLGQWLDQGGPIGAGAALLAGAVIMILVGLAYGELASRVPLAGADYIYTRTAFGPAAGFAAGWFLLLFLLLMASFEGIALAWMLETILPALKGATAYVAVGTPVTFDAIAIGLLGVAVMAGLNLAGTASAVRFQSLVTSVFLLTALGVLFAAVFLGGQRGAAQFSGPDVAKWSGSLWVFSTAAIFYNGFQTIPQVIEEKASHVSFRALSLTIGGSIAAAGIFYLLVISCTTIATPWRWTVAQQLPTAAAAEAAVPGLGVVLLCAAAFSVMKTWNAVFITAVQTVVALSRDGVLPRRLAQVNSRHAYVAAACFVALANVFGVLMGRGAVAPLIEMASISMGLVMAGCCAGVYALRVRHGAAPYTLPGGLVTLGTAIIGTFLMAVAAVVVIALRPGAPIELLLMAIWAGAGAVFWRLMVRRRGKFELIGG